MINNTSNVTFDSLLPDSTTTSGTQDSNLVAVELLSDNVTNVKTASATFVIEGNTLTQTVVFTNNSTATLTNLFFTDTMSSGASFVSQSVTVNGVSQPTYDINTGFDLPDLAPDAFVTVVYTVIADNPLTQTPVTNTASIGYTVDDPIAGETDFTSDSNELSFDVVAIDVDVVKSADREFANPGDTITYTSVITNNGNASMTNVVFTDAIPTGTTFVASSVTVDGTSQPTFDPETGFALSDIDPLGSSTIVFEVTVDDTTDQ